MASTVNGAAGTLEREFNLKLNIKETKTVNETYKLSVTFPARVELLATLQNGETIQHELEFAAGVLSRIENSVTLRVHRHTSLSYPLICLFIRLSPQPGQVAVIQDYVTLTFTDAKDGSVIGSAMNPTRKNSCQYTANMDGYSSYEYASISWPEQACIATLALNVQYRKLPKLEGEKNLHFKDEILLGKLDTTFLFLSETFSDVEIQCQGKAFPAHRVVLAGGSPVLRAMLIHPTKEAKAGVITVNDIEPHVMKGLLGFMYTGKVSEELLESEGEALYRAADKYNIEDLVAICENHFLAKVGAENALVMYDLAQTRPNSLLAKKSSEIIAKNRDSIAADVDSFKNFTNKYPELMFEIFRS